MFYDFGNKKPNLIVDQNRTISPGRDKFLALMTVSKARFTALTTSARVKNTISLFPDVAGSAARAMHPRIWREITV
jgi:hypothetical protein